MRRLPTRLLENIRSKNRVLRKYLHVDKGCLTRCELILCHRQKVFEPDGRKSTILTNPRGVSRKTTALARSQSASGASAPASCTFTNMMRVRPLARDSSDS